MIAFAQLAIAFGAAFVATFLVTQLIAGARTNDALRGIARGTARTENVYTGTWFLVYDPAQDVASLLREAEAKRFNPLETLASLKLSPAGFLPGPIFESAERAASWLQLEATRLRAAPVPPVKDCNTVAVVCSTLEPPIGELLGNPVVDRVLKRRWVQVSIVACPRRLHSWSYLDSASWALMVAAVLALVVVVASLFTADARSTPASSLARTGPATRSVPAPAKGSARRDDKLLIKATKRADE